MAIKYPKESFEQLTKEENECSVGSFVLVDVITGGFAPAIITKEFKNTVHLAMIHYDPETDEWSKYMSDNGKYVAAYTTILGVKKDALDYITMSKAINYGVLEDEVDQVEEVDHEDDVIDSDHEEPEEPVSETKPSAPKPTSLAMKRLLSTPEYNDAPLSKRRRT